jgi:hypothetical protein
MFFTKGTQPPDLSRKVSLPLPLPETFSSATLCGELMVGEEAAQG